MNNYFVKITKHLTLSLLGTCCAGPNTDLPLNSNISKMLELNIVFINFLIIYRLIDFALVVLYLLMFKVC